MFIRFTQSLLAALLCWSVLRGDAQRCLPMDQGLTVPTSSERLKLRSLQVTCTESHREGTGPCWTVQWNCVWTKLRTKRWWVEYSWLRVGGSGGGRGIRGVVGGRVHRRSLLSWWVAEACRSVLIQEEWVPRRQGETGCRVRATCARCALTQRPEAYAYLKLWRTLYLSCYLNMVA